MPPRFRRRCFSRRIASAVTPLAARQRRCRRCHASRAAAATPAPRCRQARYAIDTPYAAGGFPPLRRFDSRFSYAPFMPDATPSWLPRLPLRCLPPRRRAAMPIRHSCITPLYCAAAPAYVMRRRALPLYAVDCQRRHSRYAPPCYACRRRCCLATPAILMPLPAAAPRAMIAFRTPSAAGRIAPRRDFAAWLLPHIEQRQRYATPYSAAPAASRRRRKRCRCRQRRLPLHTAPFCPQRQLRRASHATRY